MERNLDNREFEQYIKRNADQYRMIPSEKVWKSISNNLHTRRKWYGWGLALLLVGTATAVTWVMFNNQVSPKLSAKPDSAGDNTEVSVITPPASPESSTPLGSIPAFEKLYTPANSFAVTGNSQDPVISLPAIATQDLVVENEIPTVRVIEKPSHYRTIISEPTALLMANDTRSDEIVAGQSSVVSGQDPMAVNLLTSTNRERNLYPMTIESVVNSYNKSTPSFKRKLTWQIFFTPTVSYRKLSDNKSFNSSAFFVNNRGYGYPFSSTGNINKAVTHKPDLGLELGFAAAYPLTASLKLTAGMQFNINRYDIRAYTYNREAATINLNGGDGNNSVTTWTSYRNYNGYKSDWLKNFYFSVSAPIGAQLKVLGNNSKTYYGIAGAVQPTYILRDRAYLISTDYKNYAEVPDLIRHFNINTSFEAFVSYKSHNTRWQIGPQVRYQVMSSFQSKYPIKENLFDFGVKVGIMLNH